MTNAPKKTFLRKTVGTPCVIKYPPGGFKLDYSGSTADSNIAKGCFSGGSSDDESGDFEEKGIIYLCILVFKYISFHVFKI